MKAEQMVVYWVGSWDYMRVVLLAAAKADMMAVVWDLMMVDWKVVMLVEMTVESMAAL